VMAAFCEQLDKNPKPWMRQKWPCQFKNVILLKTRYFFIQKACNYIFYIKTLKWIENEIWLA
jgi:hypothetical protein